MSWAHNGALMNRERIDADSGYFPTLLPPNGQLTLFVRRLALGPGAVGLWASHLLGNGIHVPSMSSTWLVMHEIEHGKHAPDL
jgi:hypothetical protein